MTDDEALALTKWRLAVDDRLEHFDARFQSLNIQQGAMERSIEQNSVAVESNTKEITDLKTDIQAVVDLVRIGNDKTDQAVGMLTKNENDLNEVLALYRTGKGGWTFAEGLGRLARPFLAILAAVSAFAGGVMYFGKSVLTFFGMHFPK